MRPVKLTITGFSCFKDEVSLEFKNLDLFVISGATGSGKSSLLDAIMFALFGQAPRTGKQGISELISLGRARMSVVFDFLIGEHHYRVSRSRSHKGAAQAQLDRMQGEQFVAAKDDVKDVDHEIERLLGMTFDAFTQAVVLPQGEFEKFLQCQPRERRDMLNELLRLTVYEQMREMASKASQEHERERSNVDRRLAEDFKDVSPESLAQLEQRRQDIQNQAEEQERLLTEMQQRRDEVRRDHAKTTELAAKEKRLGATQKRKIEIESLEARVSGSRRAAPVVPILDQADRAGNAAENRTRELRQAELQLKALEEDLRKAETQRNVASNGAEAIASLRERQMKLAEVLGRLPLRDNLLEQLQRSQQARQQRQGRLGRVQAELSNQATAIQQSQEKRAATAVLLKTLGYDAGVDERLERVRESAGQLRGNRAQLSVLKQKSQAWEEEARVAEVAAGTSTRNKQAVVEAKQNAVNVLRNAEAAWDAAKTEHAASHLRGSLAVGASCPVCRQAVAKLPQEDPVPVLKELEDQKKRAEKAAESAQARLLEASKTEAAALTTAKNARKAAEESRTSLIAHQQLVAGLERKLEDTIGAYLEAETELIETRILGAVAKVAVLRETHRQMAAELGSLDTKLARLTQSQTGLEQQSTELEQQLASAAVEIKQLEDNLQQVTVEIQAITHADDPAGEQKQIEATVNRLTRELESANKAATDAEKKLEIARGKFEEQRRAADDALAQAQNAEENAAEALRQVGFSDAGTARTAILTPSQVSEFDLAVRNYQHEVTALEGRVRELLADLHAARVSDEDLRQVEEKHRACDARLRLARQEAATRTEQVRGMTAKLNQASRLREELILHTRQHQVFARLAIDLRNDRFQAYMLEETLGELICGASAQLSRLTGGRLELNFENDKILVVDKDNASETRSTDTLSGGETFLASLELALELSAQIQRAVGAVHLDCLFIDEGFGTLDPETLRVVADSIRSLQVGGRMVGIITHIPELKEEFDQRVLVVKDGGISHVTVENN